MHMFVCGVSEGGFARTHGGGELGKSTCSCVMVGGVGGSGTDTA